MEDNTSELVKQWAQRRRRRKKERKKKKQKREEEYGDVMGEQNSVFTSGFIGKSLFGKREKEKPKTINRWESKMTRK